MSEKPLSHESGSVPVVDISAYFNGSSDDRRDLARQIDNACRTIGFLVITGHGVPEALIDRAQSVARAFFDLPLEQKRLVVNKGAGAYRGYRGLEASVLAYSRGDKEAAPDLRELFSIGRLDIDEADPYYTEPEGARTIIPNVWTDRVPAFEPVLTDYYRAMERLSLALMRLFALALELDENWFDDKVDKDISTLQLSHYPAQREAPLPGQLRASAHSDWGSLTILKAEDRPGGLEVFTQGGEWQPVPIIPNTFIINIGDLMAQWTNDRWVSTLHRVVNPPRENGDEARRLSLVFFHQPNYDALVECLPTCDDSAPKYPMVTSGDYLRMRVTQTFGATKG
jgi:isopenicillin N synthase-like dioxygenase